MRLDLGDNWVPVMFFICLFGMMTAMFLSIDGPCKEEARLLTVGSSLTCHSKAKLEIEVIDAGRLARCVCPAR